MQNYPSRKSLPVYSFRSHQLTKELKYGGSRNHQQICCIGRPPESGAKSRSLLQCNPKEQSKFALLKFEDAIKDIPEIIETISVSGNYDYMLKIVSTDIESYNKFIIDTISNLPNIGQYHSSIVMTEVKKETAFKIPHPEELY